MSVRHEFTPPYVAPPPPPERRLHGVLSAGLAHLSLHGAPTGMPRTKPAKVQKLDTSAPPSTADLLSPEQRAHEDAVAAAAATMAAAMPLRFANAAATEAVACQDASLKYWLEPSNQPVGDDHQSRWRWELGDHAVELFATMFGAAREPDADAAVMMAGSYKNRAIMALRKGPERLILVSDGALRARNMRPVITLLRTDFQGFFGPEMGGPAPPGHPILSAAKRDDDDPADFRAMQEHFKAKAKQSFVAWTAAGRNVFWKYNATASRRGVFIMNDVNEFDAAWEAISERKAFRGVELEFDGVSRVQTGDELGGAIQLGIPTHPDLGDGNAGTVRVYLVYDPVLKQLWYHKDTIKNTAPSDDAEGEPITGKYAPGYTTYDVEERGRGRWLWESPPLKNAMLTALRKLEARLRTTILPEVEDDRDIQGMLCSSHNAQMQQRANDKLICFYAADIVISDPAFESDNVPSAYVVELNFPMPLTLPRLAYYPRLHLVEQFFPGGLKAGLPSGVPWWPWQSHDETPDIGNANYLRVS